MRCCSAEGFRVSQCRIVSGVAVVVGHVIVADDIARLQHGVAFPAIGDGVAARVENAMGPLRAPSNAALHQAAMHIAFRLTYTYGGKHFEVGVVQDVCGLLEQLDLLAS